MLITHTIPGRTRLHVTGDKIKGNLLEAQIRSLPGITSVTYSPVTGSILLYHTYEQVPKNILRKIQSFLPVVETEHETNQARDLGIVLGAYTLEKLLLSSLPFAMFTPTTLAVLYASRGILKEGFKNWRKPTSDTLTSASILASIAKGSPSSAFVIFAMSTISEILTERTAKQTRGYVKKMMEIDTKDAWLIKSDGTQIKVSTEQVKKGDKIIVFHGEKVPFDGTVTDFCGHVEQSSITGEYMPVAVAAGDYVYAGSIMTEGKIILEVDKVGEDLAVNRMIKLIEEAQDKQANIQSMSEKFTTKMVPLSFALAAMIYLVTKDWNRVLNMLVIDYVCGVKLSTATAISATIGKAARKGVLVKGGQTLETLSKLNTIIFDKTGTITEGRPTVQSIATYEGYTETEVLALAASAEEHSSHPIAEAILSEVAARNIPIPVHDDQTIENIVGRGVRVVVGEDQITVGSRKFMEESHISVASDAISGVFVAKGDKLIGVIEIDDKIRQGMNRSINKLRRGGVDEVVMVTGDHLEPAKRVANRVSIDEFIAEAMPKDKADFVKAIKEEKNRITMMVGDGINDAPALAYADIGVSLGGKKTDIAMETSDIVIHSDNPMLLPEVVKLSKQVMTTIKQNITATLLVNTAAIVFGSLGIFPPIVGAAIHNVATIGVVLNSARLILTRS